MTRLFPSVTPVCVCQAQTGDFFIRYNEGSLHYILTNERYCGSVLTWKTFTADIFEHKKRKNCQNRDQYLYEDVHEAIIQPEQFEAVQTLLENRKHRVRSYPQMRVIDRGIFQGYVPVNHHWVNDDPNSYYEASNTAARPVRSHQVRRAAFSAFDLRGFQVVRGVFLSYRAECPSITVTEKTICFNAFCQKKFSDVRYIQLLIHPAERKLAIRPCRKESPDSIRWRIDEERPFGVKSINCPYFASALFQIMGWNPEYRYRIRGIWAGRGEEQIIVFTLENGMPVTSVMRTRDDGTSSTKQVELCPPEWADRFGEEFYAHSMHNPQFVLSRSANWDTQAESNPIPGQMKTKTGEELQQQLSQIKR